MTTPLIIEAAISPFTPNAPVFDCQGMVREAKECLAAGAGIIHHHHDYRLDAAGTTAELTNFGLEVLDEYPDAIFYGDFVHGTDLRDKNAHLPGLAEAGALRMVAVDPGVAWFGMLDGDGMPAGQTQVGSKFQEANEAAAFACSHELPVTVGVYEPGNLRWALALHEAGKLPRGSMVKIFLSSNGKVGHPGEKTMNVGLPPLKESIDAYVAMLGDSGIPWVVTTYGTPLHEHFLARYIIEKGGHIRVGIEDSAGLADATNRETVEAIVALANQIGRPVATGSDVTAVLENRFAPAV